MNRREQGIALILALMALLMLSTLGAGLVLTTSTEAAIGGNFRRSAEARYAARAAADRAIADLSGLAGWDPALTGAARSTFSDGLPSGARPLPGGSAIDLTQIVNLANCGQAAGCTPSAMDAVTSGRPWGTNNPRWQLYAWGFLSQLEGEIGGPASTYLAVLVGDDGAENDGDPAVDGLDPGNPGRGRLLLRALAFGASGTRSGLELTLFRAADGSINILTSKDLQW